jgi:hypothetical protein
MYRPLIFENEYCILYTKYSILSAFQIVKRYNYSGWQRARFEERHSGVEGEIMWRSLL